MNKNNLNISTMFLLPGIEIKPELMRQFRSFGFLSSYLTCKPYSYPYEVIYLLFEPKKFDLDLTNFVNALQKNTNFIEVIDLAKKMVIVYRIPKKFRVDYNRFMKGEYSKLSTEFQRCFILEQYKRNKDGTLIKDSHNRPIVEPTMFHHIFKRTQIQIDKWKEKLGYDTEDDILDDMELYDIQDPEKETYILEEETWLD